MKLLVSDYAGECGECHKCMVRIDFPGRVPGLARRRSKAGRCTTCVAAEQELKRREHLAAAITQADASLADYMKRRRRRLATVQRVRRLKDAGVLA